MSETKPHKESFVTRKTLLLIVFVGFLFTFGNMLQSGPYNPGLNAEFLGRMTGGFFAILFAGSVFVLPYRYWKRRKSRKSAKEDLGE